MKPKKDRCGAKAKPKIKDRLPRISLYPLTPEEAISASLKVDPKKIIRAEKKAAKGK
ncbi:MAG: hypothetical protein ABSG44_18595 [Thermodesulfobacteriota bacterium]|jgi:hypothetical protein